MDSKVLQLQQIPDFQLPDKYKSDIWEVQNWDAYINGDRRYKSAWNIRSSVTDYKFDFTLCNNPILREELKYCIYVLVEIKKITLVTFAEKYDYFKHIAKYLNSTSYMSITEITSTNDFEKYIIKVAGNKARTQNGNKVSPTTMTAVPQSKRNRALTFFETCIQTVIDFYEKDIPEIQKDIWHAKNLPIDDERTQEGTLDFRNIKNLEFKQQAKDFCFHKLNNITFHTISSYLLRIKRFFSWLDENYPKITHLDQLTRDIIEEYFLWLRMESDLGQTQINNSILILKVFFETGMLLGFKNFPYKALITTYDYAFKTKKESQYFTDEELQSIINIIPEMKTIYGKMLYILLSVGVRISELIYLEIDCLHQYEDKSYYILIYQYKTKSYYEKPISDNIAKIIQSEINKNKKKYGDSAKYVFTNKNKPICYSTFCNNLNTILAEHKITDRNGLPLKCNTHRFRHTVATNLFKSGKNPKAVAEALGQSSLGSLAHYVVINNSIVKEQLAPRIKKDELLISNIGKIDDAILSEYEHVEPLCNGWCCRNSSLGACNKANTCLSCEMFIPTTQHLINYQLQLQEVEATIKIAEANNLTSMLEKNIQTRDNLINIIEKVKNKMEVK